MRAFLTGAALGPPLLALFLVWSSASGGAAPATLAAAPTHRDVGGAPAPAVTGSTGAPLASLPRAGIGDVAWLRERDLLLPVEGVRAEDLRDSFAEARGSRLHQAIDILAGRGTPVRAVDDGVVERLVRGARGGLSVYQLDASRAYGYYYAHLDGYAPRLREGASLRKGDLLGYVGTTGNAPRNTPHLHFAIFRLEPEAWWRGAPVNPFLVLAPLPT